MMCVAWVMLGVPASADPLNDDLMAAMAESDVVILGEVHDNPDHHARQAEIVKALQPRAVVWEMLTQQQAAKVDATLIADFDGLEAALNWDQSGWPDFAMYYPIFAAAPKARVSGGNVPRAAAIEAMKEGAAGTFGADATTYGLTQDLPESEAKARTTYQMTAHCDALPEAMVPGMIDIQRLRDAVMARAAVSATETGEGPVVIITGNGHGRRDWGIPVYLNRAAPELRVFSLGQSEDGQSSGTYDAILDSPAAVREDPCAAFQTKD